MLFKFWLDTIKQHWCNNSAKMPVDMMIEAMKVAYTKSKSRYSMSSLMSKSSLRDSQLGILALHSTSNRTIPRLSIEALNVDKEKKFCVSFSVKVN